MAKIDFSFKLKTLDGSDIPEKPDETIDGPDGRKVKKEYPPLTLKTVSVNALLMQEVDGDGRPVETSGEEKVKRFQFATRIYEAIGSIELQSEEITLLKRLIARAYLPLTVGQAWEILDPSSGGNKK